MNSKERVMRAIAHNETDRVPVFMDCTTSDVLKSLIRLVGAKDEEDMHKELGIDCCWCNCMEDLYPHNSYTQGYICGYVGHRKSQLRRHTHWPKPEQIDFNKYVKRMEGFSQYAVFGGMWGLSRSRRRCLSAWKS